MEKWLICIPVVKNPDVLRECLDQIMHKRGVHITVLLNGADQDVKNFAKPLSDYLQITIAENSENVYVTKAWNLFLNLFINSDEYDRLIILNSDLSMQFDWARILRLVWEENPEYVVTPNVIHDKLDIFKHIPIEVGEISTVDNPPGIFITFNKEMAKAVYPIPEQIRVWFNDSYIYAILKALNYPIVTVSNLMCFHHVSTSVNSIAGIHEVIEQDKIAWKEIVEPKLQEKIKQLKNKL